MSFCGTFNIFMLTLSAAIRRPTIYAPPFIFRRRIKGLADQGFMLLT